MCAVTKGTEKKNFHTAVLRYDKPVVVDVWADWCAPCHALTPHFAAAAEALEGKACFVKLDAEKNQKLVKTYKVRGLPTLLYFENGKLVDRSAGVSSKGTIMKRVKPLLSETDQAEMKSGGWWRFYE